MMRFFWAWRAANKQLKMQEREAHARKIVFDDPITIELLEKLATEHRYYFEVINRDGTVLRFSKKDGHESPDQGAFW